MAHSSSLYLLAAAILTAVFSPILPAQVSVPVPGQNVNMVSGTQWPGGDPNLQRQNEPSIAVSTRNPMHLLAGANDYRTVDLPGLFMQAEDNVTPDAWLGVFKSFDGGMTWRSGLLPGCPYKPLTGPNPCIGDPVSPLWGKGYNAGADPVVRAGASGLFHYSFIAFERNNTKYGALAVATFIDDNNKETGDTIRYLGASIVDENTGGQFVDKPFMAVDLPRPGAPTCSIPTPGRASQIVPAGRIHVVYTIFLGSGTSVHSALMVATSSDCGKTWSKVKVSEGDHVNQGATIAIDPGPSGALYVGWRRFKTSSQPDTIQVVRSTDGGKTFSAPVSVVPAIDPFDQKTSQAAVAFRTNSYPTMAVLNGRAYIAWADRLPRLTDEARVILFSSADGAAWTSHGIVDPPLFGYTSMGPHGHQIMPALTAAGGKLMLLYYDFREDHTTATYISTSQHLYQEHRSWTGLDPAANVFSAVVADAGMLRRHTIDVRAVQLSPSGSALASAPARVSKYAFGTTPGQPNAIRQLGFNPPNLPLFRKGTVPFLGDYIDINALNLLPTSTGWTPNTDSATATVFHAAWTDNRNVYPGDVTKYAPPQSTGGISLFDPGNTKPACVPGMSKPGVLNQDVYTARITQGLVAGSYGNAKPLSENLQRAFSFFVQNTKHVECKSYRLTIDAPNGVRASFKPLTLSPLSDVKTLEVTIGPKSGIARTVFAKSVTAKASIRVLVQELQAAGCSPTNLPGASLKPNGLQATVILNPEIENPEIENPEIENPIPIASSEVYNPEIENPEIENPEIENPEIENPEIENPEIENVEVANPEIENPEIENPEIENPEIENPEIENIPPDGRITDVSWKVVNKGNTTTSYNAKLLASRNVPESLKLQLLVHKLYRTPVAATNPLNNCQLRFQTQNVVLVNIPNPVFTNAANIENPEIENASVTNGTFSLAPGESAKITLRFLDPDVKAGPNLCGPSPLSPCNPGDYNPVDEIQPVPVAQPPAPAGSSSVPLVITSQVLPDGVRGNNYVPFVFPPPMVTLQAIGGTPASSRTWTIASGSLPSGLTLNTTGTIIGTPGVSGAFYFVARIAESCTLPCQPQEDTQGFTIRVHDPIAITPAKLSDAVTGVPYTSSQLAASGGLGPFTWSITTVAPAPAPTAPTIAPGTGVVTWPSPVLGSRVLDVLVQDSANPAQARTRGVVLNVFDPLQITTVSLANGTAGFAYSQSLAFSGGHPITRTWTISAGSLPPGLALTPSTGLISGTPLAAGSYSFTVFLMDGADPAQTTLKNFAITVAAVDSIQFIAQPQNTPMNWPMSPVVVRVLSGGAPLPGAMVSIAIGTNPSGGVLSGTLTVAADVSGVAHFRDLSIDRSGVGYTLTATSGPITGTSSAFTILLVGASLTFVQQPVENAAAGGIGTTIVQALDATAAVIPNLRVDLTLQANPGSGTLFGTVSQRTDALGRATFTGLRISGTGGGGNTLGATGPDTTAGTTISNPFAITAPCFDVTGMPILSTVYYDLVYYVSAPNPVGDRLMVGRMPPGWGTLLSTTVPLPNAPNQRFCSSLPLAPGYTSDAYVPTSFERSGSFPRFDGLLLDPLTPMPMTPFPGGIVPFARLADPLPWRIGSATPCALSVALTGGPSTLPPAGGSGSITVTASNGTCGWAATSSTAWLTLNAPVTGLGSGAVLFSAGANPASPTPRVATISVAGQTFLITQN